MVNGGGPSLGELEQTEAEQMRKSAEPTPLPR